MEEESDNNSSEYITAERLSNSSPPQRSKSPQWDGDLTLGELLLRQPKDPTGGISKSARLDIFSRLSLSEVIRTRERAPSRRSPRTSPDRAHCLSPKRSKTLVSRGTSPVTVFTAARDTTTIPAGKTPQANNEPAIPLSEAGQTRRARKVSAFRDCMKNPSAKKVNFRVKAYAKGTVYRQDMVLRYVEEAGPQATPAEIMGGLSQMYPNPSTLLTVAGTLQGQKREFAKDQAWRDGMRSIQIQKTSHRPKEYPPVTPKMMTAHFAASEPQDLLAATMILMWITASRHADLAKFIVRAKTEVLGVTFLFCTVFGVKSDVLNRKNFVKVFAIPPKFEKTIQSILPVLQNEILSEPEQKMASLAEVQRALTKIQRGLVTRSVRGGASKALRKSGLSMVEIAASTLHGLENNTGSLDAYLRGCWMADALPRLQIFNSLGLMEDMGLIEEETLEQLKNSDLKDIFLKKSQCTVTE